MIIINPSSKEPIIFIPVKEYISFLSSKKLYEPLKDSPIGNNPIFIDLSHKQTSTQTLTHKTKHRNIMGKVRTSYFRSAEPSATVQYVRPNQTFPTAALIDYVVNRNPKPDLARRVSSFITGDSYRPDPVEESGTYFAAAADDFIDLKAANYILQRKNSLQYDSD